VSDAIGMDKRIWSAVPTGRFSYCGPLLSARQARNHPHIVLKSQRIKPQVSA
jgi:hypothetical protein